MKLQASLVLAAVLFMLAVRADASPPIVELSTAGISPQPSVFDAAGATAPLVIKSEQDAAAHFAKEDLPKLAKLVDFSSQVVLIFAWKGSGGDKLTFTIAESAPEQVTFTLIRGRTRDLRPHIHIYALRSDVKWSAR